MRNVRAQTDRKTFKLLSKANMRQLNPEQLDGINQIFRG